MGDGTKKDLDMMSRSFLLHSFQLDIRDDSEQYAKAKAHTTGNHDILALLHVPTNQQTNTDAEKNHNGKIKNMGKVFLKESLGVNERLW